jgi:hypothetical protein
LIEYLLWRSFGEVAGNYPLYALANGWCQLLDDLVGSLLGRSQPAILIITTLDETLDACSKLANKTAPKLQGEIVIVA